MPVDTAVLLVFLKFPEKKKKYISKRFPMLMAV
jgi:hypothetical protein